MPEIRMLTALTKLDVSENQIKVGLCLLRVYGFVFRVLGLLPARAFADSAPQDFPEQLGDLPNLETLWAFKNKLGPALPEWFGKLTALTDLNLFNNSILKLPDSMSNLVAMDQLNLASNKIIRVPSLDGMVNLKRLALYSPHP